MDYSAQTLITSRLRPVESGETLYIALPSGDPCLVLAAEEISRFLSDSAGMCTIQNAAKADLSIVFACDESAGFEVRATDRTLTFIGDSPIEILYAVYHFAEQYLGYCFYQPGVDRLEPLCTPPATWSTFSVVRQKPLMKNRGFIQEYPPEDDNFRLADWMAKNKLNYLLVWMKDYDFFSDELKAFNQLRGIKIESGHHNFDYFIPLQKYATQHPDYFAEKDGQRIRYEPGDDALMLSKQLCTTNPDLRRELAKNMIEYAKAHPELDTISLIPNDGFGWCECERCAAFYDKNQRGEVFSVSAHVYPAQAIYHDLITDISKRVRSECPHLTLTLAAYINYIHPSEGFTLEPGMAAHVAPYWHCINHALHDANCPINQRYWQALQQWGAARNGGDFNIYEYYMGVNHYVSLPMVHHRVIFEELKALASIGANGILTQFHLTHWSVYGLNYYMMSKAAYGQDASQADTAIAKLFGRQAESANAFYDALRTACTSLGGCHIPIPRPFLRRIDPATLESLYQQAKNLSEADEHHSPAKDFVVWIEYMIRFKTLFDRYWSDEPVRNDILEFSQWIEEQHEHSIFATTMVKRYLQSWIKAIDSDRPWLHFNIDWEDVYVRQYDTTLESN